MGLRNYPNGNTLNMKIRRHSKDYNFIGDKITGTTFRWGETFKKNPQYAPWPELADISISNHCAKGCDFCYRDSKRNYSFMSLADYEYLIKQLKHPTWGNVFQVALGGGEPLEHPDIMKIIDVTCKNGVVPNFTTNGKYLTNELIMKLKDKVGAIAISTLDIRTIDKKVIQNLKINKIKCNLHYVLNHHNLGQAINILSGKYNQYVLNVNSIVFLTYKPLGRGDSSRVLKMDKNFLTFVKLVDNNFCSTRIGFDACFVPMLMHYTNVDLKYIDPCECAFFSVYIDEKLVLSSFLPRSEENLQAWVNRSGKFLLQEIYSLKFKKENWVLLNCGIHQQSKDDVRIDIDVDTIFLPKEKAGEALNVLNSSEDIHFGHFVEEYYYLFKGEIPWGKLIQPRKISELFDASEKLSFYSPYAWFSWESYHSRMNDMGNIPFLTRAICDEFNLKYDIESFAFFDKDEACTKYFHDNFSHYYFIEEKHIRKFLKKNNLSLIWCEFGYKHGDFRSKNKRQLDPETNRFRSVKMFE